MKIEKNILSLLDKYDAFFIDIYGVLYNGTILYEGVLDTMKKIKKSGKKIIILSNATLVSEDAKRGCEQKGMLENIHYDKFITSGEYLHYVLTMNPQIIFQKLGIEISCIKNLFLANANLFSGSQIIQTESFDKAELMYIGITRSSNGSVRIDNLLDENNNHVKIEDVVNSDWRKLHDAEGNNTTLEFALILDKCIQKNKSLLIANPDIFSYELDRTINQTVPIFTQGILGRYYEKLGGKVIRFGKPYKEIFEFAKQFVDKNDKIAMIGDTPWTDIIGANNFGIDSVMVMTGVTGEFLKNENSSIAFDSSQFLLNNEKDLENRLEFLFETVSKKLSSVEGSNRPTHIIESFA